MKVFIAAKWEERFYARRVMDQFEAAGHRQTLDWTKEDDTGLSGAELDAYLEKCARADLDGVLTAEVLVVLSHPNGRGMFVEMGVALASNIPIIIVDRAKGENVYNYLSHITHVATVDEALDVVKKLHDKRFAA